MEKKFTMKKLAAAVGAATLAMGLSAPASAVVVVGGDNGWEISFDGNVNAFYVNIDADDGFFGGAEENESRVTSGFLPAFFSFNVKSPTVNGLTGSARISFAPTIQDTQAGDGDRFKLSGYTSGGIQGASIDTREVLANVDGSFGTISFGRTLSIFGRQAILSDMTLFGVGFTLPNNGGVTAGRIGHGYTYPDFKARFAYKTPNINGFQAEIGMYDPNEDAATNLGGAGATSFDETDTPRFEGEASYATTFTGGTLKVWVDGQWQELDQNGAGTLDATVWGFGAGGVLGYGGFALTGYWYTGEGLGQLFQYSGAGILCNAAGTACEEAENDGWYVQGTYTFNGKTKVGASYGESNQDAVSASIGADVDRSNEMWTVGVYHDITSWLKVIGEYSNATNEVGAADPEADIFSVGSFITW